MNLTKEEAWELIELQLEYCCPVCDKNLINVHWGPDIVRAKHAWHYGRMELRELLDAIYDD